MVDIVDRATRSRMMSGIRGKHTRPELVVRGFLHRQGLRFRLHRRSLPGAPDLVFPRFRTALFVHGCFWHQHPKCGYATKPATNQAFWQAKLQGNSLRDRRQYRRLRSAGWRVLVIWECQVHKPEQLSRIARAIKSKRQPKR
jgi:DNA mismatch endonuclease, patch repair protein